MGGQTGGEYGGAGGGDSVPVSDLQCVAQVESLAFDEPSGLSFSGADVLAFAGGTHTSSLRWSPDSAPATFGPEQGESNIEMTVLYSGGQVTFVHYQSATPSETGSANAGRGGAPNAEAPTPLTSATCQPDRLEIEVVVRLNTSGGALTEEFEATLSANSPTLAQLVQDLPLEALSGTFTVSLPEGYSTRSLKVDAYLQADSFRGGLWGQVDVPQPKDPANPRSGSIEIQYAQWPAPNALDAP